MRLPGPGRDRIPPVEQWSTARRVAAVTAGALGVALTAFLWPVDLGGCTSLEIVSSPEVVGAPVVVGDVAVTRCSVQVISERGAGDPPAVDRQGSDEVALPGGRGHRVK